MEEEVEEVKEPAKQEVFEPMEIEEDEDQSAASKSTHM